MPLEKVFEKDFNELPWKIYAYIDNNNSCDVFDFLDKGIHKNQKERFISLFRGLAEYGHKHYSKPTFGVAGPSYSGYDMCRFAVNKRRIYSSLRINEKEVILIIGRNKKTQKTSEKHIKEFQNIINKIMAENGERK